MNDEYEGDGFKPLRTTTSWTSLPDKDSEIARLNRIIDAERGMQAKLVADVTLLSAEIAKLVAEIARLETEDGRRAAALRHAAGMVLAYADAEDRMADECRTRNLGANAVMSRCRVRNILKRVADRIATDQPAPSIGGYDRDALGDDA